MTKGFASFLFPWSGQPRFLFHRTHTLFIDREPREKVRKAFIHKTRKKGRGGIGRGARSGARGLFPAEFPHAPAVLRRRHRRPSPLESKRDVPTAPACTHTHIHTDRYKISPTTEKKRWIDKNSYESLAISRLLWFRTSRRVKGDENEGN